MGNKICGGEETPWVNFSINCIRVNNSENINIDRPDGQNCEEDYADSDDLVDSNKGLKSRFCCCCIPWLRRNREVKSESEKLQSKT